MKSSFQEFLESNCDSVRSYSGRGMFGRDCIGITVDDPVQAIQDLAWDAGEQGVEFPSEVRWDSMGRNYIVYWPYEKFNEENADEDEDSPVL